MAARLPAPCTHPSHLVDLVFYLGESFAGRRESDFMTHAVHWCRECGAICQYEYNVKTGAPHEVWRSPRRA